jgi:hypothetical protein
MRLITWIKARADARAPEGVAVAGWAAGTCGTAVPTGCSTGTTTQPASPSPSTVHANAARPALIMLYPSPNPRLHRIFCRSLAVLRSDRQAPLLPLFAYHAIVEES